MQSHAYIELCDQVAAGARIPTDSEREQLSYWQTLGAQVAERAALRRLSPEQRRLRAGRGELSFHQRAVWAYRYPEEIPMLNDVPLPVAATLCDIVDEGVS
jgi:hypothetical protein